MMNNEVCTDSPSNSTPKARQTFLHVPLATRLLKQYQTCSQSQTMKSYVEKFFQDNPQKITDWWSGKRFRELRENGYFSQITDIALAIHFDGLQAQDRHSHSVAPVILFNYNLHLNSATHVKKPSCLY